MNYKDIWNKAADHQNQWESLGEDEKLEFAAKCERERVLEVVPLPKDGAHILIQIHRQIGELRAERDLLRQVYEALAIECIALKADNLALLKTMVELRAETERLKTTMVEAAAATQGGNE